MNSHFFIAPFYGIDKYILYLQVLDTLGYAWYNLIINYIHYSYSKG